MTMPRHPLLRLFLIAAFVELIVGTTTWHPPLRDTVAAARHFWERDDVQRAPLEAWRNLCDKAGRMLGKPDGVWARWSTFSSASCWWWLACP